MNNLKNCFWKDVFKALAKFQQQLNVDWDEFNPYQTHIFYNENLLIGGKSFFYKSWQDKGIFYIRDFMDSNGNFLNLHAFSQSTTINSNFLKYQGVIECLRKFMEKKDNEGNTKMNMIGPILPKAIKSILKQKKGSQNIYIVLNKNNDAPSGKNRWNHIYNIDEKSWEYIFWPLLK